MLNFKPEMCRSSSRRANGAPAATTVALLASQLMLSIIYSSQVATGEQRPDDLHRGLLNNLQESPLSKHLGAKKLLLAGGRTLKQSTTEPDQRQGANGADRLHQNGDQRFQYQRFHDQHQHHQHHHRYQPVQQQPQHLAASGSKFNEPLANRDANGPRPPPPPPPPTPPPPPPPSRQLVDRKDDRRLSENEPDRPAARDREQFEQQPAGGSTRSAGRPRTLGAAAAASRSGSRPNPGSKPPVGGDRSPSGGDNKNSNVDLIETKQSTHSEQHDVPFDHPNERGPADEFGDDGSPQGPPHGPLQGPFRGPPLPVLPLLPPPPSPPSPLSRPRPYDEHVADSRPLDPAGPNNYEPSDSLQQRGYPATEVAAEEQQQQGTEKGSRHPSANIRVVFNNNPQFIIGSNTGSDPAELLAKSTVLPVSLQRKTRQPSSSLTNDDFYYSDESSLAETKLRKPADHSHQADAEHGPCNKQHAPQTLPANLEHVDLGEKQPLGAYQKAAESPPAQQQQQQYEQLEQQAPNVGEPPKTTPSKPRPSGKAPPLVQEQYADDRQPVDLPFEQLIKSGLRPPLRMIISMQNKYGDVMKVPLNLHGSKSKAPTAYANRDEQTPAANFFEAFQQVEQKPSGDENTPIGGDVFDPSIVKPFVRSASKRKRPQYEQQQQQQQPAPQLPTPQPQVKPSQEQYEEVAEPAPKAPAPKQTRAMEPEKAGHYEGQASSPAAPEAAKDVAAYQPADRKPDCHHQEHAKPTAEEQPQQDSNEYQTQQQQQQLILPMSVVDSANGLVQMAMPKLTQLQNKTFAGMLEQFQAALQEQMANHWAVEQRKQLDQDEAVKRQQDEQEDLMVALMASNMTSPVVRPGGVLSSGRERQHQQQQQQVSMTVITPPKGMTVQEAILAHAREGGPAVAILHSAGGRSGGGGVTLLSGGQAGRASAAQDSPAKAATSSSDSNNGGQEGLARPLGVSVQLKPSGRATSGAQAFLSLFNGDSNTRRLRPTSPDQATPALVPVLVSSANDEIDPDGFSSAASLLDSSSGGRPPTASRRFLARLKRNPSDYLESNSSSPASYRSLEAADKLVNRSDVSRGNHTNDAPQTLAKINDRLKSIKSSISNSLAGARPDNSSERVEQKVEPLRGKGPSKARASGDHDFLASASQQDEVSSSEDSSSNDDDDSDSDGDADESSARQSDEPSASASSSQDNQAPDDSDYGGGALSADDFDADSSASADLDDDEPYNQAASSDRISDSSSFEIPSIDINPEALQQRGCRTVLREVQEIPLDGLGAVRADGQPGSGYASPGAGAGETYLAATTNAGPPARQHLGGLRVRRSAPGAGGAINSRKVSSIVMTKECHFPSAESSSSSSSSDDDSANQRQQQQQRQLQLNKQRTPTADDVRRQQHHQQQLVAAVGPFVAYDIERRDTGPAASRADPDSLQDRSLRFVPGDVLAQPPPSAQSTKQLYANLLKARSYGLPSVAMEQQQQQQQHLQPAHPRSQVLARRARQSADQLGAPPGGNQAPVVANQSMLTRRSTAVAGQLSGGHSPKPPAAHSFKPQQADLYQGAASGRNEVVARKLYKPPSADDPYHTLSYSSQTGVDPDMDQDEDDSAVMGPDEDSAGDESAAASSGSRASRPRSARPSESLSESEIEALQDPNHDDTDPGGAGGPDEPPQLSRPIDDASDADETDGDLTDESRPLANQQRFPGRRQQQQQQQQMQRSVERRSSVGQLQARPVGAGGAGSAAKQGPILGRSFKFEREVSRPQLRSGFATNSAHQRLAQSLKPGQQVAFESSNGRLKQQTAVAAAAMAGAIKRPIARQILAERREDSLDDDEGEDGDESEGDSPPAAASSSAGRRQTHADEESPDSDPEYNPRESHLPGPLKPKKVEKSFAYVHRDLPKKGSRNPDDFVVSYGRGNLQTEQEDYDSDRDLGPQRRHSSGPLEAAASRVRAANKAKQPLVAESIQQEQFAARRRPAAGGQTATGQQQQRDPASPSESGLGSERDHSIGAEQAAPPPPPLPVPTDDSVSKKRLRPRIQRPILMTRWR